MHIPVPVSLKDLIAHSPKLAQLHDTEEAKLEEVYETIIAVAPTFAMLRLPLTTVIEGCMMSHYISVAEIRSLAETELKLRELTSKLPPTEIRIDAGQLTGGFALGRLTIDETGGEIIGYDNGSSFSVLRFTWTGKVAP